MARSLVAVALLLVACAESSECTSAKDCPLGKACISGVCKASEARECTADSECPLGERCSAAGSCELDVPATDGGVIDAELGLDGPPPEAGGADAASRDASPSDAAPADSGFPSDAAPPDSGPCASDRECGSPPQNICAGGACTRGCNQPMGLGCGTGTSCDPVTGHCVSLSCSVDGDCLPPSFVCQGASCVVGCVRAGGITCGASQVCDPDTGRCVAGQFALGTTCGRDLECSSGMCLPVMTQAGSRRVCSQACSGARGCPQHFTCGDLGGMRFCLGEDLSSPPATFNTPAGGLCTSASNQCQSTWCNTSQNTCLETCSRNADCFAFGDNCQVYSATGPSGPVLDDLCLASTAAQHGAACVSNSDCQSGVCDRATSTCARLCCGEVDCDTSQTCSLYDFDAAAGEIRRICRVKSPSAGALGLGASCLSSTECESELCGPVDVANPNGSKRCSTMCCTDVDCSGVPGGASCRPGAGPVIGGRQTLVGFCDPVSP
ncbi:MAG: hypothetical protein HY791_38930 [Deltaproteobacteria bacterium]|nr:hypothetical protein [Deltaproteobacteria bacterium]